MSDKPIQQDIKKKFYKNDRWILILWIAILYSVVNGYSWPQTTRNQFIVRTGILFYFFITVAIAAQFRGHWLKLLLVSQAGVAFWSMAAFNSPVLSFIAPIPAMMFEEMLLGQKLSRPPYVTITYALTALFLIFYNSEMNLMTFLIIIQSLVGLAFAVRIVYVNLSTLVRNTEEILQTNEKLNRANQQIADLTAKEVRQEVARDLHDTLTQDLVGINMRLTMINQLATKQDYPHLKQMIAQTQQLTETSIKQSRRMIKDYRRQESGLPGEKSSLKEATLSTIAIIKKDYALSTKMVINKDCQLLESEQADVQRVIGEALMNVVKHGETDQAQMNITVTGKRITIEIINHGQPWDPQIKISDHFGIRNMEERTRKYNGEVAFHPLTKGLKVTATFDIKEAME